MARNPRGMPPAAVRSRRTLEDYLSQSLYEDYYERSQGRVRKVSTALKTYLIELHPDTLARERDESVGLHNFEPISDGDIWKAQDDDDGAYFFDFPDHRFALLHTIELTNQADAAVERFVNGSRGVDRCWFSSGLLTSFDLGQIIGFRFLHQRTVAGLRDSEEARQLAEELARDSPPAFRLSISEYIGAEGDLEVLRRDTSFGPRSSINSITWRKRSGRNGLFIHDELWSTGKMSGYGTSWDEHLSNALHARARYREMVLSLEEEQTIEWDERGLEGFPVEIRFESSVINDPYTLARDICSGTYPFRIWGVTTPMDSRRDHGDEIVVGIDAIDLHTNSKLDMELSSDRLLVYLRRGACGNAVPRLMVNLEQHVSAELSVSLPSLGSERV